MITYKNKSLKVKILNSSSSSSRISDHAKYLAFAIKEFIETGEYRRIVDWKIFGSESLPIATIIYEAKN